MRCMSLRLQKRLIYWRSCSRKRCRNPRKAAERSCEKQQKETGNLRLDQEVQMDRLIRDILEESEKKSFRKCRQ